MVVGRFPELPRVPRTHTVREHFKILSPLLHYHTTIIPLLQVREQGDVFLVLAVNPDSEQWVGNGKRLVLLSDEV